MARPECPKYKIFLINIRSEFLSEFDDIMLQVKSSQAPATIIMKLEPTSGRYTARRFSDLVTKLVK